MAEKDLANQMKQKEHTQKLLEKIRKIEDEIKLEKGTNNINVKYHEDCELTLGGNVIKISVAEVEEKRDLSKTNSGKDNNINEDKNDIVKTYNIYINVKGQDVKIAEINEEGKLIINEENIEKIDPKNALGLKEIGEDEKPDISEINKVEGKTSEELEEELAEEKEQEKEENKPLKEKAQEEKNNKDNKNNNSKKINIGALKVLFEEELKEYKEAELDKNNELIFKDEKANKHTAEEVGFTKAKTISGSYQLNKMNEDGRVSTNENPTNLYTMKGKQFGISVDSKTHHREVNVAVRGIDKHNPNSFTVVKGNLTHSDSGDITKYQTQERIGTKEGWDAGERSEMNKKTEEIISSLNSDDAKKVEQGLEKEMDNNHRVNDNNDLKRVIANVLQEKWKESPDDAMKIATDIVDNGKEYDEIKEEMKEETKENEKEFEGRDRATEALERMMYGNH